MVAEKLSQKAWDLAVRNEVRKFAEKAKKGRKIALYLPSSKCRDLANAIRLGIINKETLLIIVEGDKDINERKKSLKTIRTFLTRNQLTNVYIHDDRIHKLKLEQVLEGKKIDFMFFDICGNFSAEIANWFHLNQDHFEDDMYLPMTLAIHPRGMRQGKSDESKFVNAVNKNTDCTLKTLQLNDIPNNLLDCEEIQSPNLLRDVRVALKALYFAFSRRNLDISYIRGYRNDDPEWHTNMMNLHIKLDGKKVENDTFENIVKTYDKNVSYASQLRRYGRQVNMKIKANVKKVMPKTAYAIARHLEIFGNYSDLMNIPRGKEAWITILAKKAGLCPNETWNKIYRKIEREGLDAV
jgi:hypothetical protein